MVPRLPPLRWYARRARRTFKHGPRAAYYSQVVRPRILYTRPVENTHDARCEIHTLTSQQDWLNLIWALKSFYTASGRRYALCIHDDGTLDATASATLRTHFPAARFIPRAEADVRLAEVLAGFPRLLELRNSNLLAPKIFDFVAFLESERMALLDSDLLFFSEPTAYLECVENHSFRKNVFTTDLQSAYTVDPDVVRERAGFKLRPNINTGFGLVQAASVRWEWLDEFVALPGVSTGHHWRIEQTLYALCSSRYGVELLPADYSLYLGRGIGRRPFRHYVGRIRHLMYLEGMAQLSRQGFLRALED
jgi:hypothetical protein